MIRCFSPGVGGGAGGRGLGRGNPRKKYPGKTQQALISAQRFPTPSGGAGELRGHYAGSPGPGFELAWDPVMPAHPSTSSAHLEFPEVLQARPVTFLVE